MSGRIAGLWRFTEKGRPGEEIPEAVFIENKGMEGDRFADGGERQVTLLPAETAAWMAEQETPVLCFRRYKSNVQTAGFAGRPGRLSGAGLFLKVARGGSICVGDEIKRL